MQGLALAPKLLIILLDSITSYQRLHLSKINYENNTNKILAHKLLDIVKEKSSKQQDSK